MKTINIVSVAYDLPRLWGRALSQPILDRSFHLHPPGAVGEVGWLEKAGSKRRQCVSCWPRPWSWNPASINFGKMFPRIKAKRAEIDNIKLW